MVTYVNDPVGEEDEVSIKEAAEAVVGALDFKGEVVVSFYRRQQQEPLVWAQICMISECVFKYISFKCR